MCVYMGICTLILDHGHVMFLGPGTGTSRVSTSVGAQVIKTCDWNN